MKTVTVSELRQHASVWLREVQRGESFEVTSRGRPIARLMPVSTGDDLQKLVDSGRLSAGPGAAADLPEPLSPEPGGPLPSAVLETMRAGDG